MIDWEAEIERGLANAQRTCVTAVAYRRSFPTASRPALVLCSDRQDWIVKGAETAKTVVSERVVCTLGKMLNAPIVPFGLVDMPARLIHATPALQHMSPGLAHGTTLVPKCADAERTLTYLNPENRPRYAALHVLYSWTEGNDHQVLFQMESPVLVFSHDHGHFFPAGPNWTESSLANSVPPHEHQFFSNVGLMKDDYAPPLRLLDAIQPEDIVTAVVAPPQEWACTMSERAALAQYLWDRKDRVVALFGGA